MSKHSGTAIASTAVRQADATRVAQSVRSDFSDLVAIFDRHLGSLPDADRQTRLHAARGKAAAKHGLQLSLDLIEALRR
jgi:hypothetical protein